MIDKFYIFYLLLIKVYTNPKKYRRNLLYNINDQASYINHHSPFVMQNPNSNPHGIPGYFRQNDLITRYPNRNMRYNNNTNIENNYHPYINTSNHLFATHTLFKNEFNQQCVNNCTQCNSYCCHDFFKHQNYNLHNKNSHKSFWNILCEDLNDSVNLVKFIYFLIEVIGEFIFQDKISICIEDFVSNILGDKNIEESTKSNVNSHVSLEKIEKTPDNSEIQNTSILNQNNHNTEDNKSIYTDCLKNKIICECHSMSISENKTMYLPIYRNHSNLENIMEESEDRSKEYDKLIIEEIIEDSEESLFNKNDEAINQRMSSEVNVKKKSQEDVIKTQKNKKHSHITNIISFDDYPNEDIKQDIRQIFDAEDRKIIEEKQQQIFQSNQLNIKTDIFTKNLLDESMVDYNNENMEPLHIKDKLCDSIKIKNLSNKDGKNHNITYIETLEYLDEIVEESTTGEEEFKFELISNSSSGDISTENEDSLINVQHWHDNNIDEGMNE